MAAGALAVALALATSGSGRPGLGQKTPGTRSSATHAPAARASQAAKSKTGTAGTTGKEPDLLAMLPDYEVVGLELQVGYVSSQDANKLKPPDGPGPLLIENVTVGVNKETKEIPIPVFKGASWGYVCRRPAPVTAFWPPSMAVGAVDAISLLTVDGDWKDGGGGSAVAGSRLRRRGEPSGQSELLQGALDVLGVHDVLGASLGVEESGAGDGVDQARKPAPVAGNQLQSPGGVDHPVDADAAELARDVLGHLLGQEPAEVVADVDALGQRRQELEAELLAERSVADQDQRQRGEGVVAEVEEEPEFLEHLQAQEMGLVMVGPRPPEAKGQPLGSAPPVGPLTSGRGGGEDERHRRPGPSERRTDGEEVERADGGAEEPSQAPPVSNAVKIPSSSKMKFPSP